MATGATEKSTDAITALLQERRRFEQWLATLESRRAITPANVYARVHADYTARLSGVLDQLGGRSAELQQSVDSLGAKLSTLESEENTRRDERAEAELRAAVGEYTQERWIELSEATDTEIARLSSERSEATAELAQLQQLLNMAKSRRPEPVVPVPPPAPQAAPPLTPPPTVAAPAAASAPAAAPAPAPVSAAPPPPPPPPPEIPRLRPPEPRTADGVMRRPSAAIPRPAEPKTEPKTGPIMDPSSFDELAFLKSVAPGGGAGSPPGAAGNQARAAAAGGGAAPAPASRAKLATPPEAGTLNDISLRENPATPAKGDSGSVPVFLRDVPTEQVKSLKCSECGSMNYPTEWYCERCGGELAAM
jgi:hypothetical protein